MTSVNTLQLYFIVGKSWKNAKLNAKLKSSRHTTLSDRHDTPVYCYTFDTILHFVGVVVQHVFVCVCVLWGSTQPSVESKTSATNTVV